MSQQPSVDAETGSPRRGGARRWLTWLLVAAAVVAVVVVLWNEGQSLIDGTASDVASYLIVIALVFGDAICPVLPGETTLNAACVLAANGRLTLWVVVLCGAIGAIAGDSTLYWLSRSAGGRLRGWLNRAGDAKAGRSVVGMLDKYGNIFLLFGRYVPGLRFAINVTLGGVVHMPYRKFLFWSGISGVLWSTWTCLSAYYISSALAGYPIAALIVSTLVGTVLIGSLAWVQSRLSKNRPVPAAAE